MLSEMIMHAKDLELEIFSEIVDIVKIGTCLMKKTLLSMLDLKFSVNLEVLCIKFIIKCFCAVKFIYNSVLNARGRHF